MDGTIVSVDGMTARIGGTEAECYHLTIRVSLEDGERAESMYRVEINNKEN